VDEIGEIMSEYISSFYLLKVSVLYFNISKYVLTSV
jgi:hypothetical protein